MPTVDTAQSTAADSIRQIVVRHGRLPGGAIDLSDDGDLYAAGMTSLATVGVMLALEEQFDVEFPESRLNRATFRSIASIVAVVTELSQTSARS